MLTLSVSLAEEWGEEWLRKSRRPTIITGKIGGITK